MWSDPPNFPDTRLYGAGGPHRTVIEAEIATETAIDGAYRRVATLRKLSLVL